MIEKYFRPLNHNAIEALIPGELNDPFSGQPPEICHLASADLQAYILANQDHWQHNFGFDHDESESTKGKMFGLLIVQKATGEVGYLAAYSGKLKEYKEDSIYIPSQFDLAKNDGFLSKGMKELSILSQAIQSLKKENDSKNLEKMKAKMTERKQLSNQLQNQLFEQYEFLNKYGYSKSLKEIFKDYNGLVPPSSAGECAAPKLLHFAYTHQLKTLGIAEFWWGRNNKSKNRLHKNFYPACRDKCRPILTYMLDLPQ